MPCMGFRLTWGDESLFDVLGGGEDRLDHEPRLYAAETATSMGIPFDHRWYSIPKEVREQHIAARLARISIDNMILKEATKRS